MKYLIFPYTFCEDERINKTFKHFNLFFFLFSKMAYNDYKKNGLDVKKGFFPISYSSLLIDLNKYYPKSNFTNNEIKNIINFFIKKNVLKVEKISLKSDLKSINNYSLSEELQTKIDNIKNRNKKQIKPTISKKEKVEIKEKVDEQKDFLKYIPEISENDFSNNFEDQINELYELYESQLKIRAFKNIKNNLIIKECLNNYSFEDIKLMLIATRVQIYCEASYKNPCGTLKTIYGNSGVEYDPKSKKNNWLSIQHIFNSDNIEKTLLFLKNIYEMGYSQINEEERRLFNNFMNVNKTTNQEVVEDWKYEDDDEIPIPF